MDSRNTPASNSDRESLGLRGAVRTCIEETIVPPMTFADGAQHPERRHVFTSEFDREGHLVSRTIRNHDSSGSTVQYTYDSSGLLLQVSSDYEGRNSPAQIVEYDQLGRIQRISYPRSPTRLTTFSYDEAGRKTKTQVSGPEDYIPNCATSGSPFDGTDRAPNFPDGGAATTTYDEQDRPVEVQVRDSHGELVMRAVRTYDHAGRIASESSTLDDPAALFPAALRAKLSEASSRENLRDQLTKLIGRESHNSVEYSYDPQGRLIQSIRRIFSHEDHITYAYNEHGDVTAEVTRSTRTGSEAKEGEPPTYSEARFSYQYDQSGNWVEKTTVYRNAPEGEFTPSTQTRRTVEYF